MARKRARLTRKKKTDKSKRATPEGLSLQRFSALPLEYSSFIAEDSDHNEITFATGDVAYVQYQDVEDGAVPIPEDHYWICRIKEVRGSSASDVWACVEWFWAPEEVAEVIKSLDSSVFGKYEKLFSDNIDIISVHCFVGPVEVKHFDEKSIYQEPIEPNEWYHRYNFQYDGRRITPKITHAACNICKIPYTPEEEKVLHFCPRPNCRSFYHQSCLLKGGYVVETHDHPLLETWPDIDRSSSVEILSNIHHPAKRRKKDHYESRKLSPADPLAVFPEKLVAIANQPILRGTLGGSIVGNITSVCAARSLIYKVLTNRATEGILDDWENIVDVSASFPGIVVNPPNCTCPSCVSSI